MDSFKLDDAASYNAVAASFDYFSEIVTRPLAETMAGLASVRQDDRVLDVATGSGIVALAAARRLSGAGRVTGIDLSDGLMAQARHNAATAGFESRIQFEKADAEALPFADRSFDVVLSLFALLHFPHPEKALAEMYRVLKPGGRLVIGVGARPPWDSVNGWMHRLSRVPDVIELRTGKLLLAPAHLNALVERHMPGADEPEETDLARDRATRGVKAAVLVRAAGFEEIRTEWQGSHLALKSVEEFWNLQSTFSSIARKRLRNASADQLKAIRREFDEECGRVLAKGGKLVYHYAASYVCGKRAG